MARCIGDNTPPAPVRLSHTLWVLDVIFFNLRHAVYTTSVGLCIHATIRAAFPERFHLPSVSSRAYVRCTLCGATVFVSAAAATLDTTFSALRRRSSARQEPALPCCALFWPVAGTLHRHSNSITTNCRACDRLRLCTRHSVGTVRVSSRQHVNCLYTCW